MAEVERMDPETAFIASKQETTGNEWELFKENVRPLKRGRNVRLLNQALKSQSDPNLKKSLLQTRKDLIKAIYEYEGDDPLQPWIDCIKWVQEAFPPGGECSGLVVIYEQCVRTFWHEERYRDDLRYLKVWLEYAENCVDAEVVYSFLEANKIGQTHAILFKAYAVHMESKNKIKTANDIYNRGISRNAQPIEKLMAAYTKFIARSMGRPQGNEESIENREPLRSFGTVLARGENRTRNMGSSDAARKKLKPDWANGQSFAIYKDTNASAASAHRSEGSNTDLKPWSTLGGRAERNKENNAIPAKWTSAKIPQRPGHRIGAATAATPCIEVYVDKEKCTEDHKQGIEGGRSLTLQLRKGYSKDLKKETELLRENPLRHFPACSLPR